MSILKFFDVLEDKIRHWLSHWPIIYAIIGILGIVLTWRGIWHLADKVNLGAGWSFVLGVVILLSTGLLVAIGIGDEVLISAFRGRRKVNELKLDETMTLVERVEDIKKLLNSIEAKLGGIKKEEEKIKAEINETQK